MESKTEVTYYWAPWCSSCKTVGPMLEKLCTARGAILTKVNVDAHAAAIDPRVSSYTTLPIVLIVSESGEVAFGGASVTASTMNAYIT